jgi:hypothetical protein
MRTTKRIHRMYKEWKKIKKMMSKKQTVYLNQMFGRYQYIFSSKKGRISCVELIDYYMDGERLWEICCLEGNLFYDIQRFDTFKEAKLKCKEYLDEVKKNGNCLVCGREKPEWRSKNISCSKKCSNAWIWLSKTERQRRKNESL